MACIIHRWMPAATLLCLCKVSGAEAFRPIQLTMTATIKTDNKSRSEMSHIWMKARDKFRIEQSVGAREIITIANGAELWQVDTLRKTCEHRKDALTVQKMGRQTFEGSNLLDSFKKLGGKRIGQVRIDGIVCTVFRRKDRKGITHSIWALPDGHVRRMSSSGIMTGAITVGEPIQSHSVESRVDVHWLDNRTMPETLFHPPAGTAITEHK